MNVWSGLVDLYRETPKGVFSIGGAVLGWAAKTGVDFTKLGKQHRYDREKDQRAEDRFKVELAAKNQDAKRVHRLAANERFMTAIVTFRRAEEVAYQRRLMFMVKNQNFFSSQNWEDYIRKSRAEKEFCVAAHELEGEWQRTRAIWTPEAASAGDWLVACLLDWPWGIGDEVFEEGRPRPQEQFRPQITESHRIWDDEIAKATGAWEGHSAQALD